MTPLNVCHVGEDWYPGQHGPLGRHSALHVMQHPCERDFLLHLVQADTDVT